MARTSFASLSFELTDHELIPLKYGWDQFGLEGFAPPKVVPAP